MANISPSSLSFVRRSSGRQNASISPRYRRTALLITAALVCAGLADLRVVAESTWTGGAASGNWSLGGNWTTGVRPMDNEDVIMLGPRRPENTADVFHYFLNTLQFPLGAPSFTIHIKNVDINGAVINDSGIGQTLFVDPGHLQGAVLNIQRNATVGAVHIINEGGQTLGGGGPNEGGTTYFDRGSLSSAAASAGQATIDNRAAAVSPLGSDRAGVGSTEFHASSTGGNASINNFGGPVPGASGGFTFFLDTSTAGAATIHNIATSGNNGGGGHTYFWDNSTAGSANLVNDGTFATGSFGAGATSFLDQSSAGNATILNNPGSAQPGRTQFSVGSTAADATIINGGGTLFSRDGGETTFLRASGGAATINNEPGTGLFSGGGSTTFFDSTAANAVINNNAAESSFSFGGTTFFRTDATAGNATINNNGAPAPEEGGGFLKPEGFTVFESNSDAGEATINNNGGTSFDGAGGQTIFQENSSAQNATIVNNGGTTILAGGGTTIFNGSSSAGNATLIANGGVAPPPGPIRLPGLGGSIVFNENSSGGTARAKVFDNAGLDISAHSSPGVSIGSIEGNGNIYLGANTLTVGNNNLATTFSGAIQDGGGAGGTGGSLTKVGTGSLTLAGVNTYTGSTAVKAGTLMVDGSIAASSGVTVDAGATLGGHGMVSAVSGEGTVSPGNSPGILTAGHVDPSDGMDFFFELTQAGSPDYADASDSGNDVLHLIDLSPFTTALTSENQITLDFSDASPADGQVYRGGFFTDSATATSLVSDANFLYLGLNGFTVEFDGFVAESIAEFDTGTVLNGTVLQFTVAGLGPTPTPDMTSTCTLMLLTLLSMFGLPFFRRVELP